MLKLEETPHGFRYGPALVERMYSHKGHLWLQIKTDRETLEIRVTPTGLIRAWTENKELKK